MEFEGTVGVWEVNPKASRNVRCGNTTIANCSSGQNGENEEEEIANAKLIAAAPELLEALREVLKKFVDYRNEDLTIDALMVKQNAESVIEKALTL